MNQWQPIEAAPKDGTWLLAYIPRDAPHVLVLRWTTNTEGRYAAWRDGEYYCYEASHWMPLPDPPAGGGEAA